MQNEELDSITLFSRRREEGPTKPEIENLQLAADGLDTNEIAARRFRSPHTINTQMQSVYHKLGAHNAAQAVAKAMRAGIIK